jgi:hypothetical protein
MYYLLSYVLMYYLLSYVLMFLHSVLMLRILYSVLLMYYCSVLFIVYVTLPPGIGPIAVGNKQINISFKNKYLLTQLYFNIIYYFIQIIQYVFRSYDHLQAEIYT